LKHPEVTIPTAWMDEVDPASREVFQAFRRAMCGYRHLLHTMFADTGTHPGQATALVILASDEGLSQRDLAERLHVSAPTVTALLQRLEKAGVVTRETDGADQRVTRIFLTDAGRASCAQIQTALVARMNESLGPMSQQDRVEFARLLSQFGDNIPNAR
jgi:DNA-binding MarR family transcriptional regulator